MATPAPSPYTTDELLRSLKLRGYLPAANGFTSSDFLFLASEEQSLYVMAFLKGIREEFEVVSLDIAVTDSTVPFPERAAGAALRTVTWLPSGGEVNAYPLVRIEPELRTAYSQTGSGPQGFYFEGNNLVLVPATTSNGTLRVSYQQRLSRLVLPAQCLQVESIDVFAQSVVVASDVLAGFTTDERYDFNSNSPNFVEVGADLELSSVDAGTKTFTFVEPLPARLEVGDWLCLTGQCCIPQLPPEVHQLLAVHTAEVVLAGQGSSRLAAVQSAVAQARTDASALLSPRDDGVARPILRLNGPGMGWW